MTFDLHWRSTSSESFAESRLLNDLDSSHDKTHDTLAAARQHRQCTSHRCTLTLYPRVLNPKVIETNVNKNTEIVFDRSSRDLSFVNTCKLVLPRWRCWLLLQFIVRLLLQLSTAISHVHVVCALAEPHHSIEWITSRWFDSRNSDEPKRGSHYCN